MQGRQIMSNSERKGPHKSMHCKFCPPPGVVTPEKPTRAQLETKTKIHLVHEAADLRVCNVHNEPGYPAVENEACICVLEGENSCPKCVPDKNRPPPKKKVCNCSKGAKPHPSMDIETSPKKVKQVNEDDEFWWEKYSREHDALAKETWEAYMAQRRKDKKLEKCQKREKEAVRVKRNKGAPAWFQKLSCQQMIYVEYLSTAIRLDSDENITDRTYFVLGGIGLYPRPKRKALRKCLSYCHYNSIQFLNQLHILIKDDDPFQEKAGGEAFTWNERLIMNSMCHLEFPALLREIMDRLPPLPRKKMLPQIPYPVFPKRKKKKYDNPYEEPTWQDRLNWVEKMKIDRLNRCRIHMETKRVKIPPLALVRRPSLIDARPPFLAQIEANERASRGPVKDKDRYHWRKHPISTFNSAVDVTAVAEIDASEISTTDKADTDDICVFLRESKEPQSEEGEMDEELDLLPEKEVKFQEDPPKTETQVNRVVSVVGSYSEEEEEVDNMPFKTPPKTESGATIASPCPPPDTTPAPPATHFEKGRRELGVVNQEICGFFPFVSSSTQTVRRAASDRSNDIESNLKSAAEKLKKFADECEGEQSQKKGKEKSKRKGKGKKKGGKKKTQKQKRPTPVRAPDPVEEIADDEEEGEAGREAENDVPGEVDDEEEADDEMQISFKMKPAKSRQEGRRDSEVSDPDSETGGDWSTRPPCTSGAEEFQEDEKPVVRRVSKRKKGKRSKRKPRKRKTQSGKRSGVEPKGETGEERREKGTAETREEKERMTGSDASISKIKEAERGEKNEEKKVDVFRGDVGPLVIEIIRDLAEEGFHCASYPFLNLHPDVDQLVLYLKGEIVNRRLREALRAMTKERWTQMKGPKKFPIPELGVSSKRAERADWNDKKWISRLAKRKKDQFYFKVANSRAQYGTQLYGTLYQTHFGTERYLKIFSAYMTSKYGDAVLRGTC